MALALALALALVVVVVLVGALIGALIGALVCGARWVGRRRARPKSCASPFIGPLPGFGRVLRRSP
ncbi:MAG TPA: hypothetical protein VLL08_16670 [Kineosporiaceae bacterium]|nr:hypothetical protein [Kineosporiaceae bacterium]